MNKGLLRLILWIVGLLVAFFVFSLIAQEIGNGVVIVIAFVAIVTFLFIRFFHGSHNGGDGISDQQD